ncbi:hypothetical protein KP509_13G046400 [Ceratopteris richardii]|uniref:Uncharacterized protein n=1 Tax=Ceratopteris richardii TaxID=49495 RepID=A0A8T2TFG4_CERRI|nr:hypothetical protein KP509_13G046400 [Ceratopteris richardii]
MQEKEGKVPSLDETLGAANLHLSRIEREKLAAQTAAAEAMNSRKGALVEASWCRILKLAGIPCKEAILELQKAEKKAAAALAEAESKGVIVYHGHAERESSSEAVTASLDTAFDVDKEVTAAIKIALRHVSQRDSERDSRRDASVGYGDSMGDTFLEVGNQSDVMTDDCDFEEQVQSPGKIVYSRPNGKTGKVQDSLVDLMVCRIIDLSLEHQTALAGVVATRGLSALLKEQSLEQELNEKPAENLDRRSSMSSASPKKGSDLGSILVKHVSRLQREVQAAKEANKLLQVEGEKRTAGRFQAKASHVESLDQILVKHVSKLERDRLAAQTSRSAQEKAPEETSGEANDQKIGFTTITEDKNRINGRKSGHAQVGSQVDSLDQILVKHMSRLEKEKLAAQTRRKGSTESSEQASNHRLASKIVKEEGNLNHIEHSDPSLAASPVESLDRILVKHMSRLEKEKLAAQASRRLPDGVGSVGTSPETSERELTRANDEQKKCDQGGDRPELLEVTNKSHKMHLEGGNGESMNDAYSSGSAPKAMQKLRPNDFPDLGSFLVKHECRLEKEKRNLSTLQADSKRQIEKPKQSYIETGLGDILVKRLSRLELQKANLCDSGEKSENNENRCPITNTERDETSIERNSELTHGQKTQFLKSKEMQGSWGGPSMMHDIAKLSPNVSRTRILRQKQMEDAWGGVSLGNALRPHVSKLEMEQAAWRRAEQEARQRPNLQRL